MFAVSSSGMVRLRMPLDHETAAHYSVPILARSSKLFDLTVLDVFVLDENDNHPEFKAGSCYGLATLENQDTIPLHTITAYDPDEGKNGQVTYSIISEWSQNLNFNSSNLDLKLTFLLFLSQMVI